ncbi:preprotein translocase subunit SecE [bacterium]|nr:preprotein translocase subunit SecE [bacterium]
MSNQKENKVTLQDSLKAYFKGVKTEWGKISWPQKPQIVSETIIVFIVVVFFTLFTYIIDLVFKGILGLIPQ